MTFIAFATEKKDEKSLKKSLKICMEKFPTKAMIVAINKNSISNLKNIRFDTIIVDINIKEEFRQELKDILKEAKYIIVNSDITDIEEFQNMDLTVLTYGFGSKCTITASSVEDENTLICLQRTIKNINNIEIEPQEIKLNQEEKLENQYLNMAIATVKLIYDIKNDNIFKKIVKK